MSYFKTLFNSATTKVVFKIMLYPTFCNLNNLSDN